MQGPPWVRASDQQTRQDVDASIKRIRKSYEHLVKVNEDLYKRCTEAIGTLMNEIVIAESRKAIFLTERLGKLTFLAFVFVPLSFTTSFFGMNVQELGAGDGALRIWAWFALSIPLLLGAICFYVFGMRQIRAICRWFSLLGERFWVWLSTVLSSAKPPAAQYAGSSNGSRGNTV